MRALRAGHKWHINSMSTSRREPALSLEYRLRERIRLQGPISFYDWMKAALYDEREGYYCRADCIRQGRAGDYRTAPETSPLFAATFAAYFAKLFADLESPQTWTIFEAGAGGGEFAHGVLSSLHANAREVFDATNYVIDEVSPSSRNVLATRLSEFADRVTFQPQPDVKNASAGIVFSNELIDALPVNRIVRRNGELRELFVGLNGDEFIWVSKELSAASAEYCRREGLQLSEGQTFEVNLGAERFLDRAALMFDRAYIITVDYGASRDDLLHTPDRHAGTLRAFHRHRLVDDVLSNPGEKDLTTTIDWTQLIEAGARSGLQTIRMERLDQFLLAEGLLDELSRMTRDSDSARALQLSTGAREMLLPTGVSASFQVLVQQKPN
jgi:SAM-dependent MidA family methyltransferase